MEKPKKPQEPNINHFPLSIEPTGNNIYGNPVYGKPEYYKACEKYRKDLEKYKQDLEMYEQIKLIKLVKNSTEKYCLAKLQITKK